MLPSGTSLHVPFSAPNPPPTLALLPGRSQDSFPPVLQRQTGGGQIQASLLSGSFQGSAYLTDPVVLASPRITGLSSATTLPDCWTTQMAMWLLCTQLPHTPYLCPHPGAPTRRSKTPYALKPPSVPQTPVLLSPCPFFFLCAQRQNLSLCCSSGPSMSQSSSPNCQIFPPQLVLPAATGPHSGGLLPSATAAVWRSSLNSALALPCSGFSRGGPGSQEKLGTRLSQGAPGVCTSPLNLPVSVLLCR